MSNNREDEIIEGEAADPVDVLYVEMAQETYKRNIPFLNDVLQKLITINASLFGGGIYFLQGDVIPAWSRSLALIFFLIATGVALYGMLPYSGTVNPFVPDEIKKYKVEATNWKRGAVWFAGTAMILAFVSALVGFVVRL